MTDSHLVGILLVGIYWVTMMMMMIEEFLLVDWFPVSGAQGMIGAGYNLIAPP